MSLSAAPSSDASARARPVVVVCFGALAASLRTWRERAAQDLAALQRQGKRIIVVQEPLRGDSVAEEHLLQALAGHGAKGLAAPPLGAGSDAEAAELARLAGEAIVVTSAEHPQVAASALAATLGAESLLVLDATGPLIAHGRAVPRLGSRDATLLLAQAQVPQPFAEPLRACAWAVSRGVPQARLLDIRLPGALVRGADPRAEEGTAVQGPGGQRALRAAAAATPRHGP